MTAPQNTLPDPSERPTLTIAEAATALGIARSSAYAAANSGQIPTIRIGSRRLVPTAALRRMVLMDGTGGAA